MQNKKLNLEDRNAELSSHKQLENLESATATTAGSSTTTTTTASWSTATTRTTTATAVCLLARLVLGLWGVINKQGIERQAVGKNVVADCRAANVDGIKRNGVTALRCHLDGAERGVHLRGDGCNSSVENCAY